jgi:hypothetical protein
MLFFEDDLVVIVNLWAVSRNSSYFRPTEYLGRYALMMMQKRKVFIHGHLNHSMTGIDIEARFKSLQREADRIKSLLAQERMKQRRALSDQSTIFDSNNFTDADLKKQIYLIPDAGSGNTLHSRP